jgi:hypothetical protein
VTAPPPYLGLTRWEFVEGGVRFRLWTRPIVGDAGARVVPVTLVWSHADGAGGMASCSGVIDAMERAAQVVAQHDASRPI